MFYLACLVVLALCFGWAVLLPLWLGFGKFSRRC